MKHKWKPRYTHRQTKTPTYQSWVHMKARCLNPNNHAWKLYGGRGISICDRWLKFENFLEDMGVRPEGTSLDRIDNNKGYYPDNCRWATKKEQGRNRRTTILVDYKGKTERLIDVIERDGEVKYETVISRLKLGFPLEDALKKRRSKAPRKIFRILFNGKKREVSEVAELIGMKPSTLYCRIFYWGWNVNDATKAERHWCERRKGKITRNEEQIKRLKSDDNQIEYSTGVILDNDLAIRYEQNLIKRGFSISTP